MKYLTLLLLPILTSCAIASGGSIVSGYAYKSKEADSLTIEGEDGVIEKMLFRDMDINPNQ